MLIAAVECFIVGEIHLKSAHSMVQGVTWPQRFAIAYLVLTWISAILSPYFPQTIIGVSRYEGALTITVYCLCFLLVSTYGKVSKRMLWYIGAAASAFGIICIIQLAGWNPFSLYPTGYNYSGAYIDYAGAYLGTVGNVDLVSAFLCIIIPLAWTGLLRLRGRTRFLLLIPLGISLVVLIEMSVMAGIVGVVCGGVLSLPVVLPIEKAKKMRLAFGVLALVAVAMIVLYFADIGSGTLHEAHEILHGNWNEDFGSGRIHIWKAVLEQIPAHLFFGIGPDTMLYAGLDAFTKYHEDIGTTIVSQIDVAHNEYLNILFHQGILSLVTYWALLISLAKAWIQRSSTNATSAMLGSAALCYCTQAFFCFSMCITAPFFWVTLALLDGCGREKSGGKMLCGGK